LFLSLISNENYEWVNLISLPSIVRKEGRKTSNLIISVFSNTVAMVLLQQGRSWGKTTMFEGWGKVRAFVDGQGKSVKVSKKSWNLICYQKNINKWLLILFEWHVEEQ